MPALLSSGARRPGAMTMHVQRTLPSPAAISRGLAPVLRLPALAAAHAIGRPALWALQQTPWARPIYHALGRRMELTRTRGGSFDGYRPDAHDVFVCSFGKSGTNWTLQIAHQIAHLGNGEFGHIHDVVPWPDELARGYAVALDDPAPRGNSPTGLRIIKTHLPMRCIPYSPDARYVCVVRDPKDVAVSGYHFFRAVLLGPLMPPVHLWVDHFLTGESALGCWARHLHGFWEARHHPNVLFIRYEEMQRDHSDAVDRIATLMGVTLTPQQRESVLEKSTFEHMRRIDHKFYPGLVSPLGSARGKMMREGRSKASGSLLSETQQRQIDAACKEALQRLGSDFPYDEAFAPAGEQG